MEDDKRQTTGSTASDRETLASAGSGAPMSRRNFLGVAGAGMLGAAAVGRSGLGVAVGSASCRTGP